MRSSNPTNASVISTRDFRSVRDKLVSSNGSSTFSNAVNTGIRL